MWALIDRVGIDPLIAPALNQWRRTLGLPPVRRVFKEWINSPRLVVGLFPDWFGPRQPDWPTRFHHASFPLWDDARTPPDLELTTFLDAGTAPVVVSPGSANRHATSFFAAAAAALRRLGRRGLFLTGFAEQLPPDLPNTILHRAYAPFSAVLPRAAALVHHGGIGTMAQGFAAGVPQLVMAMAFDQPDNAVRASQLGVARWLAPARFTADRVTAALEDLLGNPVVARAAAELRDRLREQNGIALACDLLERETA
jgi:UDP:flavonoid glycosyltransferase YjiC (YdhE family)